MKIAIAAIAFIVMIPILIGGVGEAIANALFGSSSQRRELSRGGRPDAIPPVDVRRRGRAPPAAIRRRHPTIQIQPA